MFCILYKKEKKLDRTRTNQSDPVVFIRTNGEIKMSLFHPLCGGILHVLPTVFTITNGNTCGTKTVVGN